MQRSTSHERNTKRKRWVRKRCHRLVECRPGVQMWHGRVQSGRRCGRGESSPGADVAGLRPVPVQMWAGRAQHPTTSAMTALNLANSSSSRTRLESAAEDFRSHTLHRDSAQPAHICTGTGLNPATSAPEIGSPAHICATAAPGPGSQRRYSSPRRLPHCLVRVDLLHQAHHVLDVVEQDRLGVEQRQQFWLAACSAALHSPCERVGSAQCIFTPPL